MSEIRVERPTVLSLGPAKGKHKVTFCENDDVIDIPNKPAPTKSEQRKNRNSCEYRWKRKRNPSCSFAVDVNKKRKQTIVLPTKFLLGGNITDPLNLGALEDEKEGSKRAAGSSNNNYNNRANDSVRVIIAPNINDPLNLDACSEDGEEELTNAISQQRRKRKRRKRRNSEPTGLALHSAAFLHEPHSRLSASLDDRSTILPSDDGSASPAIKKNKPTFDQTGSNPLSCTDSIESRLAGLRAETTPASGLPTKRQTSCPELRTDIKEDKVSLHPQNTLLSPRSMQQRKPRQKSGDKIVSPVIPQPIPGKAKPRSFPPQTLSVAAQKQSQLNSKPPSTYNPKNSQFQFGNYNQYYGYRNPARSSDVRLQFLPKEWFCGRRVLDIGCNIGHITLSLGRDYYPASIVGLDIDRKLIRIAKKNVKHYLAEEEPGSGGENYPKLLKTLYGPSECPVTEKYSKKFPHNVRFLQGNYVLENDALLETVKPEFDIILCFSVTKWIHLNWGDRGLKRFFKRAYSNLHPGGMFIVEPQGWKSYLRKNKLTQQIFENFKEINLFPDQFGSYLVKEVGFVSEKKLPVPPHRWKGFCRPIYVYKKGWSDSDKTVHPVEIEASTSRETGNSDQRFQSGPCIVARVRPLDTPDQSFFPPSGGAHRQSATNVSKTSSSLQCQSEQHLKESGFTEQDVTPACSSLESKGQIPQTGLPEGSQPTGVARQIDHRDRHGREDNLTARKDDRSVTSKTVVPLKSEFHDKCLHTDKTSKNSELVAAGKISDTRGVKEIGTGHALAHEKEHILEEAKIEERLHSPKFEESYKKEEIGMRKQLDKTKGMSCSSGGLEGNVVDSAHTASNLPTKLVSASVKETYRELRKNESVPEGRCSLPVRVCSCAGTKVANQGEAEVSCECSLKAQSDASTTGSSDDSGSRSIETRERTISVAHNPGLSNSDKIQNKRKSTCDNDDETEVSKRPKT